MPLRDHFRPPLDDVHAWDEVHGMWPAVIVQHLIKILPEPYFAAPQVHLTFASRVQEQDVYEVRIIDSQPKRRLVAAIEIVSPSNKDRPENRNTFISKVSTLLKHGICVSIVDIVSTLAFNLHGELLDYVESQDPALATDRTPLYAATIRTRFQDQRQMMDAWYHPIAIGDRLPTLPIWLTETWAISLDLEASYEETCRTLRIR